MRCSILFLLVIVVGTTSPALTEELRSKGTYSKTGKGFSVEQILAMKRPSSNALSSADSSYLPHGSTEGSISNVERDTEQEGVSQSTGTGVLVVGEKMYVSQEGQMIPLEKLSSSSIKEWKKRKLTASSASSQDDYRY